MIYHVITNLELMFDSLDEALAWAASRPVFRPRVPDTAMRGEDAVTPRVCGARTISDCVTAVGALGVFRRCLNANEFAKSYENDDEVYPVLVAVFEDEGWFAPSPDQVPDVRTTHELWKTSPVCPVFVELRWLDAYSLRIVDGLDRTACVGVTFLDDTQGKHHPWLDGRGHPLDCSAMGDEPWPDAGMEQYLYLDLNRGGHVGLAVPVWPPDGRLEFRPVDANVAPYKTFAHRLRKFSSYYDKNLEPIFEGYVLLWDVPDEPEHHRLGEIRHSDATGWSVRPWDEGGIIELPTETRVLTNAAVHVGHGTNREIRIPDELNPPRPGRAEDRDTNDGQKRKEDAT